MKANIEIKVRIFQYKSFRHYGGREIITTPFIVNAKYLYSQDDHTELVELLEACAGYPKGCKLAIIPINFNV